MRYLLASATALTLLAGPAGADSGNGGGNIALSARVPVICKLIHRGEITEAGNGFHLGQLSQYCNSPNGFTVSVDYSPGSLRNTSLKIGEAAVVLDGSGHAELYRGAGPRIGVFEVSAVPGSSGFDADRLEFRIDPN